MIQGPYKEWKGPHHFGDACVLQTLLLQHPHQVAVQLLLPIHRKELHDPRQT